MKNNRTGYWISRGMVAIEYALLFSVVVIALIGMSVFLKRAISGRGKQSADVFGFGRQYAPGNTTEVAH